MWAALEEILAREHVDIHEICSRVDKARRERERASRQRASLTAALRMFILTYYREAATETGHREAGHGSTARHRGERRV